MLRSMFSSISGLRSTQTQMDVVGNNISNVNTTGFKASLTRFSEILAQTVKGPGGSTSDRGSTPGQQIGLGTKVAAINRVFGQGPLLETGRLTDFAIQGDGFFILARDANLSDRVYSRDGSFNIANDGTLVNAQGFRLLGWNADSAGAVNTSNPLEALRAEVGQRLTLRMTSSLTLKGNLDGSASTGTVVNSAIFVFDSKGGQHTVPVTYTKTANPNEWQVGIGAITDPDITSVTVLANPGPPPLLVFDPSGNIDTALTTFEGFEITYAAAAGLEDQTVANGTEILADFAGVQQVAGSSEINQTLQDGFGPGTLASFSLSEQGELQGIFTNGHNVRLGIVSLAGFLAPDGLLAIGGNSFVSSPASGDPTIGQPGRSGHGSLRGGTIEGSNVDLAQEFTLMIQAQRGFQANARIITTSDEMLQELAQLKR